MISETLLVPHGRYVRSVAGADFSLQANTSELPETGIFYVLRGAQILFQSAIFEAANAHYKELCRVFWSERLVSGDASVQMASAWGLLGIDIDHAAAAKTILRKGTPAELKRFQNIRNRARHGKPGGPWARSGK